MGIPSYYKKLIDTVPGLVVRSGANASANASNDIQWLFMDYNCLIYHCLRQEYQPQRTSGLTWPVRPADAG